MKQLFFACLFLSIYAFCFSQKGFRLMGFGSAFNIYPKKLTANQYFTNKDGETQVSAGIYYYYHSFHKISGRNLYFTTGSKIDYDIAKKYPSFAQRFGVGFRQEINKKKSIYYSFGSDFSINGVDLYGITNILFKSNGIYYILSPEINSIYFNYYNAMPKRNIGFINYVGCGFAIGWDKKEFYPDKGGKKATIEPFNVGLSLGYFHQRSFIGPSYRDNNYYIGTNATYRIFKTQIISPELGFGFIYAFGKTPNVNYNYFESIYLKNYAIYQDFMPYFKLGYGIQTRKKTAFIANFSILPFINFKGAGNSLSVGIKRSISKDLSVSLAIERTIYSGKV